MLDVIQNNMVCFKTTRSSGRGYQQTRSVSDVPPRFISDLGDSTQHGHYTGMPLTFTLGDTEHFDHRSLTSKQRKAGSSRETAKPRHSARQGDLMGSLVVSTDENRDRIKTGPRSSELGVSPVKGVPESSRLRPSQTTAI